MVELAGMGPWRVCHRRAARSVAAALFVALAGCAGPSPGRAAGGGPGWIGSISGAGSQAATITLRIPSAWSAADLILAFVASDGPDTEPVTTISRPTTAVLGGASGLTWTRLAHVSARHDWSRPSEPLERYGASIAEIWAARVPRDWTRAGSGTITVANSHPETADNGFAATIVAFANGRISGIATLDGLSANPEWQRVVVPACSDIFAATFAGRANASFDPVAGYHLVVQRRAGDDTAGVLASDSRCLPASSQRVGYSAPNPGDFWEMAIAIVGPAR